MVDQTPLNKFRTLAYRVTNSEEIVYTTPYGITTIVLGAQVSNLITDPVTITVTIVKNSVDYILLNEFEIPPNDSADITTGKLVLEEACSVKIYASENNACNLVLSALETSNE
jgi:hypothetical protein